MEILPLRQPVQPPTPPPAPVQAGSEWKPFWRRHATIWGDPNSLSEDSINTLVELCHEHGFDLNSAPDMAVMALSDLAGQGLTFPPTIARVFSAMLQVAGRNAPAPEAAPFAPPPSDEDRFRFWRSVESPGDINREDAEALFESYEGRPGSESELDLFREWIDGRRRWLQFMAQRSAIGIGKSLRPKVTVPLLNEAEFEEFVMRMSGPLGSRTIVPAELLSVMVAFLILSEPSANARRV